MNYIFHILIMICYYSMLAIGLELLVHYGGIWFLGIPVCSGLGAYAAVLFTMKCGFPVILGLPIAVSVGFLIGAIFAIIFSRIKGDFFLIISLGMCEVAAQLINEFEFTGGAIGIMNIPPLGIGNFSLIHPGVVLSVFLVFLSTIFLIREKLLNSVFRILILGSGDDQNLLRSQGLSPFRYIMLTFFIAGAIAGAGGWLFAHYASYLDASILSINETIMIFCMVIVGGLNPKWGFILGASIFYTIPLLLQKIGFSDSVAFQMRPIFFGATLILFMFYISRRERTI